MKKNSGNHGMTIEDLARITQKGFEDLELRMDKKFGRVDKRFEVIGERLDVIDDRLEDIEWELANKADTKELIVLEKRVHRLEKRVLSKR